jgi:predicted metal-binding membrane protein
MNTRALDWRNERPLLATCALAFIASAWVTVAWCGSLCDMPGMGMWFRMPGQSRLDHFAMFEGMWMVMMVAMMMPVLVPALIRYRQVTARDVAPGWRPAAFVAGGYFAVWTVVGMLIYPLGIAVAAMIAEVPALSRVAPWAAGLLVILAGVLQFSRLKARQLECCRRVARPSPAWRYGVRTGWDCVKCCAGPTATLLVLGVMDLVVMAVVTAAIAWERLTPSNLRAAPAIGVLMMSAGLWLCVS